MKLIKFDGDLKNDKKSTTNIDSLLKKALLTNERDLLLDIDDILDLTISKHNYKDVFETLNAFVAKHNKVKLETPFIINKLDDLKYVIWDFINSMKYKKGLSDQILNNWPLLIEVLDDDSISKLKLNEQ